MSLTNAQKLVESLIGTFQILEDVLQQCLIGRSIQTALGQQLTDIGVIVGRPRDGVTDDEIYRRLVRAQISVNTSDGLVNELIGISDLIVFDPAATYVVDNHGIAALTLTVQGVVVTIELSILLISFLRQAVSAGVRLVLETAQFEEADMFSFFDGPGLGFGDTTNPATGGAFASAME